MKVLFPVESKETKNLVASSFGYEPLFLVYNTEIKEELYIKNTAETVIETAELEMFQAIPCLIDEILIRYSKG